MLATIKNFINEINEMNDKEAVGVITDSMRLREDLGLDSMDLAILTAKIEDKYNVDVLGNIYPVDKEILKVEIEM